MHIVSCKQTTRQHAKIDNHIQLQQHMNEYKFNK